MDLEIQPPVASSTTWSFLDKFSPEIFSFGFDPEILSCFWGLFRSADASAGIEVPRLIPTAPFYIAVHSKITGGSSPITALQCMFATSGVVLGVALSSYGVYTILRSAREKMMQPEDDLSSSSSALTLHSAKSQCQSQSLNPFNHNPANSEYFQMSKDSSYYHLQFPVRPTSLNVGIRSTNSSNGGNGQGFKIWGPEVLQIPRDPYDEYDLDELDLDDMSDIRGEYFGPANTSDLEMDSFDDSGGSSNSNFQTPCA